MRAKLISVSRRFDEGRREGKKRARALRGQGVGWRAPRLAPVKSRKRRQRVITGACRQPQGEKGPSLSRGCRRAAPPPHFTRLRLPLITTSLSRGRGRQFAVRRNWHRPPGRNRNAPLPSLSCLRQRESLTFPELCAWRQRGKLVHFGVGQALGCGSCYIAGANYHASE